MGVNNDRFRGVSFDGYLPALEPPEETETKPSQESEWTNSQWDIINQLRAEVLHYRQEHSKLLVEMDKLRTIKKKKDKAF